MPAAAVRRQLEEAPVELHEAGAMADRDDGRIGKLFQQELVKVGLRAFVERARRFVQKQPVRLLQQRACDREPLLLAA